MLKKQIKNFIFIGIINTSFSYVLYALFIYIGFNYFLASLFSTILGVLFNFQTIKRFVFIENKNASLIKFYSVYVIVYIVNITAITLFVILGLNDYISGLLAIFPSAIMSFILNKFYVFRS